MEITREEAQASMARIEEANRQMRRLAAYGGTDMILMIWGAVWFLGYLGNQFVPVWAGLCWLVLILTGIAATIIIGRRSPVKSPLGRQIGIFWGMLYVFIWIWFILLWPFFHIEGAEQWIRFSRHMGAFAATVPMFAYVVMGLWLDRYLLWIGVAVTGLTLVGLYLVYPYFFYWMAVAGGGTLAGTGVLIRRRWR
jgi:hypothetical protein